MSAYDSPEDEKFFGAIGRLAVSWAMIEAGLDFSISIIHQALGGSEIEAERPISLKRKLKYLKRTIKAIDGLSHLREGIDDLCKSIVDASETRHDIIHGFVIEHIEKSGEAKLVRLIQGGPIPKEKPITVTTESILKAANRANSLATGSINLAVGLTNILIKSGYKAGG